MTWDDYLARRLTYPRDRELFDTLEELRPLEVWRRESGHTVAIVNGVVVSNVLRDWLWDCCMLGLLTLKEYDRVKLYVGA